MAHSIDALLDDFAIRSFRDVADGDYIAARMAYRAGLAHQFLWASQQSIEKHLKCVLLLNRIPAAYVKHDLDAALSAIRGAGKVTLDLTEATCRFIERLDQCGRFRYFEVPNIFFSEDLVTLDRAVWELRRYCTRDVALRQAVLRDGLTAPRVWIPGGQLETIIADRTNTARTPLLWKNAFFGRKPRRSVRLRGYVFKAANSPLWLNPEILDEVLKYVHVPKNVQAAYRKHAASRLAKLATVQSA